MKATKQLKEELEKKAEAALTLTPEEKLQTSHFLIKLGKAFENFKGHAGEHEADLQVKIKNIFRPLADIDFFDINFGRAFENDTRTRTKRVFGLDKTRTNFKRTIV